jgi:hypothetical protein
MPGLLEGNLMAIARLVNSKGEVIVEQMDFTPSPEQVVVVDWSSPSSHTARYVVSKKTPEVRQIHPGAGLPPKWMNIVEVELELAKKPPAVRG